MASSQTIGSLSSSSSNVYLPPEVWSNVFSYAGVQEPLDPNAGDLTFELVRNKWPQQLDLYRLSRVSRTFHRLATPLLYHAPLFNRFEGLRRFVVNVQGERGKFVRNLNMNLGTRMAHELRFETFCDLLLDLPERCPNVAQLVLPAESILSFSFFLKLFFAPTTWSTSLRYLSLRRVHLPMEDIDDSISPPASDPEWKHVRVRALTEVDLSRTWADDYLVCTLLTYPGFSNLKTLRLAECHEITDDMGPIFALALRAGSGSDGDGDGDEEGRSQKETEGALIESPFDAAWTGYAFVRDPPRRICVRLSTLDLSGTFLLGIDGLGDRWEDVEETSEEGSDGGSEGLSEEGSS